MRSRIVLVPAVLCVLFVLSPIPGIAEDQTPKEPQRAISLNVLELIAGPILSTNGTIDVPVAIDYEQVLADHFVLSVIPGLEFFGYSNPNGGLVLAVEPWVEVDWHPFDTGLKGFFAGLAGTGVFTLDFRPSPNNEYFLGIAPVVGYQFLLGSNIDLDMALGWAFGLYTVGKGMFVRADIGLGYRF